jgi:protein gp37
MAQNSAIEWTDHTANFWWGCFKVSDGCKNCYAETLSNRYGKSIWGPPKTTGRELKKGIWKELPKWNEQARESGQRRRVFVQSMADFFEDHPQVTEWRWNAICLMEQCKSLDFQVLTKRPENILSMVPVSWQRNDWPSNVWIGTSVENQETADQRIPELLKIPAKVRFLSCEPLLGPIDFYKVTSPASRETLRGIQWVIVGGESGPHARPMHPAWARSIRDQCQAAGVPFFMKQMDKKTAIPSDLMIREWPEVGRA